MGGFITPDGAPARPWPNVVSSVVAARGASGWPPPSGRCASPNSVVLTSDATCSHPSNRTDCFKVRDGPSGGGCCSLRCSLCGWLHATPESNRGRILPEEAGGITCRPHDVRWHSTSHQPRRVSGFSTRLRRLFPTSYFGSMSSSYCYHHPPETTETQGTHSCQLRLLFGCTSIVRDTSKATE